MKSRYLKLHSIYSPSIFLDLFLTLPPSNLPCLSPFPLVSKHFGSYRHLPSSSLTHKVLALAQVQGCQSTMCRANTGYHFRSLFSNRLEVPGRPDPCVNNTQHHGYKVIDDDELELAAKHWAKCLTFLHSRVLIWKAELIISILKGSLRNKRENVWQVPTWYVALSGHSGVVVIAVSMTDVSHAVFGICNTEPVLRS